MSNGPRNVRQFKQQHFATCHECGELLVITDTMYRAHYLCSDCSKSESKKEEVGLNG